MIIDLFADKSAPKKADRRLSNETAQVILELEKARLLFNEVTDPYEIESLIYKMKALEMHYSFLIKEAKLCKICNYDYTGGTNA